MMTKKCTSCKREVYKGYVEFKCPNCGEIQIVRCPHCRDIGVKYTCEKCGFTGP
ncbi:MAG TPA: DUF1610 domain-containing protein [Candidatus Altiarchaeales archaeon]|nr:MAG: RNA-binding protein [Candidatus Altiarchaeales archaeon]HDN83482.1 DUF1610 domain-containing protein [Candidatus Altiarchaeales archaeon]